MNVYGTIRNIQQEYFALLDRHFITELAALRDVPYQEVVRMGDLALDIPASPLAIRPVKGVDMDEPRALDSLFKEKIFRIPDFQRGTLGAKTN